MVHTLDIAPLSESPPQKRSGMARVVRGFHSFTCTPTRSSAIGMSHTCLCLLSRSWYSFTDPEGWKAELTLVRSSPGRDSNPQPPDCKSGTCKYTLKPGLGSLKVIENYTMQSGTHDFLLTFHSNHRPISHRFRDTRRYQSKIARKSPIFPIPCI